MHVRHRLRRPWLATAVLASLAVPGAAAAAPPDRATALAAHAAQVQDEAVPSGWTGSAQGCVVGSESQASLDATLRSVNRFRSFANLAPVRFDAALNRKALASALMTLAADELDHSPGPG